MSPTETIFLLERVTLYFGADLIYADIPPFSNTWLDRCIPLRIADVTVEFRAFAVDCDPRTTTTVLVDSRTMDVTERKHFSR